MAFRYMQVSGLRIIIIIIIILYVLYCIVIYLFVTLSRFVWREGGHDGAGLTSVSLEACTRKHADTSKKQSTVSQSCMLRPAQVYIYMYIIS